MSQDQNQKVILKDLHYIHIIDIRRILYCQAKGSYTGFYLNDGTDILISKNLKTYDSALGNAGFVRSHQSYLVNVQHIRRISKGKMAEIILTNNKKIPLSPARRENILIALQLIIK